MKLKYTKFQKFIEFLTIVLVFALWGYLIMSWNALPNEVPGHYNAAGVVDRWGSKNELLIMPIIITILYALLTAVSFFPSIWNVPTKTTEENIEFVYINLKTMLILIKMEIVITFTYMMYCSVKMLSLGPWFLPLELIIIFGTIIYYIIKVCRNKTNTM